MDHISPSAYGNFTEKRGSTLSHQRVSKKQVLYSQHPLTQPQLDIGFISLISKLTLDIGVAGFLFNSHIPPTTLTLDIVMAGFILFVRLTTIWGGTPQALVLRLAWTWLDGAACIRQLQYT